MPDADLDHRCRAIIDKLFVRYGWKLLDPEEAVRRTLARARENPGADLVYLAFGVYNHALYDACSGSEGPLRWEQGYTELFRMLCERARHQYPDVWQDAVQTALLMTCDRDRFKRCVVPQAFFQFVWGHVQNASRSVRREEQHAGLSLELRVGDDLATLGDTIADSEADIEEQLLTDERRAELHAVIAALWHERPGARRQLEAVRLKYLAGHADHTIAGMLETTVKRVQELRALGLRLLRTDPRLKWLRGDEVA